MGKLDPIGFATTSWLDSIDGKWICIRGGFSNNYCASYLNGIRCDNPIATNREKWKVTKVTDDTILLQTARNKLYCDNQRLRIKCQNRQPQDWSAFKVQYQGENKFVMRGLGHWNYCVDEGSNVKCDTDESEFNGKWEIFTVDNCGVYEGPAAVMPEEYFWAVLPSPLHSNPNWKPPSNSGANPLIVDSDPSASVSPKQCRECLPKMVKRSNTVNKYGAALAVGCCELDGSASTRMVKDGKCVHSTDWVTATNYCKALGKRLCTDDEVEDGMLAYKGCDLDALLHWTNTPCFEMTPASGDIGTSKNHCPEDPYMWVVIGCPKSGIYPPGGCPQGYNGICPKQPLECRPKTEITSVTANAYGNALAVVCCDLDGGNATRQTGQNGKCISAVTWDQAFEICNAQFMRLCTLEEIENGAGRGPTCDFDSYLQWSMTPCEPPTPCCGDPPGRYPLYDATKALVQSQQGMSVGQMFGYQGTGANGQVTPCNGTSLVPSDWSSSDSSSDDETPCVPADNFMAQQE